MFIQIFEIQTRYWHRISQLDFTVAALLRATGADNDFVRRLEPRIAGVLDNLEAT